MKTFGELSLKDTVYVLSTKDRPCLTYNEVVLLQKWSDPKDYDMVIGFNRGNLHVYADADRMYRSDKKEDYFADKSLAEQYLKRELDDWKLRMLREIVDIEDGETVSIVANVDGGLLTVKKGVIE
jgi:hypothetical protein